MTTVYIPRPPRTYHRAVIVSRQDGDVTLRAKVYNQGAFDEYTCTLVMSEEAFLAEYMTNAEYLVQQYPAIYGPGGPRRHEVEHLLDVGATS
jgi:hypothetical protein